VSSDFRTTLYSYVSKEYCVQELWVPKLLKTIRKCPTNNAVLQLYPVLLDALLAFVSRQYLISWRMSNVGRFLIKRSTFLVDMAVVSAWIQSISSRHFCEVNFNIILPSTTTGARGGVVGWGTALQVGRPRVRFPIVSLEFFIDIILSVALWSWGRLSL
jgi:hypothetical protein